MAHPLSCLPGVPGARSSASISPERFLLRLRGGRRLSFTMCCLCVLGNMSPRSFSWFVPLTFTLCLYKYITWLEAEGSVIVSRAVIAGNHSGVLTDIHGLTVLEAGRPNPGAGRVGFC